MLRRHIAVGDIHGCFGLLKPLIETTIGFRPQEDLLVFLGDYIDRGRQSKEVVRYLTALRERSPERVILLKGNHEELAYNALTAGEWGKDMALWRLNDGDETITSFGSVTEARTVLVPFIESLRLSYETDTHIFVHGGIPSGEDLRTALPEDLLWDREFAYRGEKPLIVGHTPKSRVTKLAEGKIVCVDTGAYVSGLLSAYDALNDKIYTFRS